MRKSRRISESSKASKKKKAVIIILILLAFAAAVIFFGNKAAKEALYRYKLSVYPTEYSDHVDKYSAEFGIDRYLLFAVIKTESGFDPNAVSETGARGLMQIMEPTFDWIKFRLSDIEERSFDEMFEPSINIRYGAYLMDYLMERYGCAETAAAAYFSGTGTVDEWIADKDISSDGVHLDNIPSKSAAHYVSKISSAYEEYTLLYSKETGKDR